MEVYSGPSRVSRIMTLVKYLGLGVGGETVEQIQPLPDMGGPTLQELDWFLSNVATQSNFLSEGIQVCDECCFDFNLWSPAPISHGPQKCQNTIFFPSAERAMKACRDTLLTPSLSFPPTSSPSRTTRELDPDNTKLDSLPSPRGDSPSFFSRKKRPLIGGRSPSPSQLLSICEHTRKDMSARGALAEI